MIARTQAGGIVERVSGGANLRSAVQPYGGDLSLSHAN